MANALYPKFKEALLGAGINLSSDTIKVALIDLDTDAGGADTGYVYSDAHQFLSSVNSFIVGAPQTLGTKTVADGVFDAADSTFPSVSGNIVGALVIYKDTGNVSTSPLIAYIDTVGAGLPVTPNGGNISVNWDNGANKIFKL